MTVVVLREEERWRCQTERGTGEGSREGGHLVVLCARHEVGLEVVDRLLDDVLECVDDALGLLSGQALVLEAVDIVCRVEEVCREWAWVSVVPWEGTRSAREMRTDDEREGPATSGRRGGGPEWATGGPQ